MTRLSGLHTCKAENSHGKIFTHAFLFHKNEKTLPLKVVLLLHNK